MGATACHGSGVVSLYEFVNSGPADQLVPCQHGALGQSVTKTVHGGPVGLIMFINFNVFPAAFAVCKLTGRKTDANLNSLGEI